MYIKTERLMTDTNCKLLNMLALKSQVEHQHSDLFMLMNDKENKQNPAVHVEM